MKPKPCPFCKKIPQETMFYAGQNEYSIECHTPGCCNPYTPYYPTEEQAITDWNERLFDNDK